MACTNIDLYESVVQCVGDVVLPGVREYAYYIKKSEVTAYPVLPEIAAAAAFSTIAVLSGNFTLAADKVWNKISLSPASTSKVTCTSQGEAPSKTFNNVASLVVAGTDEEISAFARLANNDDLLFLVPQKNGKYRLIGNNIYHTNVNVTQDTGAASTDASTSTLEVSCTDVCVAPFYAGNIVTADGTISGATDEVVS